METTTTLATITAPPHTLKQALAAAHLYADHINKRLHLSGVKIAAGNNGELITTATNSYTLAEITTQVTAITTNNNEHDLIVNPKPIIEALTLITKQLPKHDPTLNVTLNIHEMYGHWDLHLPGHSDTAGTGITIPATFPDYATIIAGTDTFTGPAAITSQWWAQLDKLAKELAGKNKNDTTATIHTLTPNKPAIITMSTTEHHARIAIMPTRI